MSTPLLKFILHYLQHSMINMTALKKILILKSELYLRSLIHKKINIHGAETNMTMNKKKLGKNVSFLNFALL
jgi:uncharacterized membrane protein YwaF